MENLSQITEIISTLGFPIVCVIVLAWFGHKVYLNAVKRSEHREDKLYEVIGSCQLQLRELGETNAKFMEVLETYKGDIQDIKDDVQEIKLKINNK